MDVLLLLLKVTALLIFALAGAWLLRQTSAAVRHALWTATFVSVLALPLLSWMVPAIGIPVATEDAVPALTHADPFDPSEMAVEENAGTAVAPPAAAGTGIPAVRPDVGSRAETAAVESAGRSAMAPRWPRPTLAGVVLGVWLTGFITALAAIVVSLVRVRRLAAVAEEVLDPEWQAALAETSTSFGRRPARLMMSTSVAVPMAGGVWRPTIFLPVDARNWPIDQRAAVLAHETAHLAAWDPLRHLVARVALAVYWFHPLAWLAVRQGSADCEQACDQAVVACGVLPSTYARVLLALAESTMPGRQALAALPIVSSSRLERRLMAILDDEACRPRRGLALTMAVAVLLAAGAVGPLVPVSVAQPEEPMVISATEMLTAETETISPTPLPAQPSEQQATEPGPRAIAGRVVDRSTGLAVAGATVRLSHQPPLSVAPLGSPEADRLRMRAVTVTADQDGRFAFDALPAGSFGVSASGSGYGTGYFGQQSAGDDTGGNARIDLAAGERLTDITIRLLRVATISGRVTDERGDPMVASVQVLQREYIAGQPAWVPRWSPWVTDGQGAYVVGNLGPGDYLVALVGKPSAAGTAGYPSVFYSASPRASTARVVTLVSGESRPDINFSVRSVESVARAVAISGRVVGDGSPLPSMTLQLVPSDAEDGVLDLEALTAQTSATGEFSFSRVPIGEYRLLTSQFPREQGVAFAGGTSSFDGYTYAPATSASLRPLPATPTWVLDRTLAVDRPLENVEIPLQQGARIHGRVIFDGDAPLPSADALRGAPVIVRPAHMRSLGRMPLGGVEPDGRFRTVGLPPGRYVLMLLARARPSPDLLGWHVASVRVAGRETTGKPIELGTTDLTDVELVFSNRPMQLSGVVRGLDGRPVPWARVLLFPRDSALWSDYVAFPAARRIQQIVTDRFGAFDGAWVPSGEYLLAAAAAVPEFWMAPAFLNTLVPSATPVRIELGGRRSMDLRLRP